MDAWNKSNNWKEDEWRVNGFTPMLVGRAERKEKRNLKQGTASTFQIQNENRTTFTLTTYIPYSFLNHITQAQAYTAAAQHKHSYIIQTHTLIACRKIHSTIIHSYIIVSIHSTYITYTIHYLNIFHYTNMWLYINIQIFSHT